MAILLFIGVLPGGLMNKK